MITMTSLLVLCVAPVATAVIWDARWPIELMVSPQQPDAGFHRYTSVNDVAIGIISGGSSRSSYIEPLKQAVLRHTPHGYVLRAPGQCMCSFRWGFGLLKKHVPHAKWYYVLDDDTFINLQNLEKTLSAHDPAKKTVISGQGIGNLEQNCHIAVPGVTNNFYGGTGQILSAALVHSAEYQKTIKETCGPSFFNGVDADVENTCRLAHLWKEDYSYSNLGPRVNFPRSSIANAPSFVTAHHLSPEEITAAAHINEHHMVHERKHFELSLPNVCPKPSAFLAVGAHAFLED